MTTPGFRLLPVAAFFLLAVGISFLTTLLPAWSMAGVAGRDIAPGLGPALSGVCCYRLFGTPNVFRLSWGGGRPVWVLLLLGAVAVVAVLTRPATQPLLVGLVFVGSQLLYCAGEELGWRHYLLNATADLKPWGQALLTGTMWFGWHYAFLPDPLHALAGSGNPAPAMVLVPMLVIFLALFSRGLAYTTIRTQAWALPVVLHFATKASGPTMLTALGLTVGLLILWSRYQPKSPATF